MEKFKLIVLLTCHENKDSLIDTIQNILKFNNDCCIVVNNGITENMDDVQKSNVHFITRKVQFARFDTMIPLHIELKDYLLEKNLVSDYIVLLSSNQLFVKHNLYDFMKNFSASYFNREVDTGCIRELEKHEVFKKCREDLGRDNFKYQSNHDGMFFTYKIFMDMMNYFDSFRGTKIDFHGEEFLYSAYLFKNVSVDKLIKFEDYNYWQPTWRQNLAPINLDELKNVLEKKSYIMKRVSKDLNDDVRKYVREME